MTSTKTLPDYLAEGLDIVSIGINPSPSSVQKGYPFASTRNRFWPVLNRSNLLSAERAPSIPAMQALLETERIGFTDIVKKPTKSASELRSVDFKQGAHVLLNKLEQYRPRIVWFQGMTVARYFFKYTRQGEAFDIQWGRLCEQTGEPFYFISPNPSSANAAFTISDLVGYFNELATLKAEL